MTAFRRSTLLVVVLMLLVAGGAQAASPVIIRHIGSADPNPEGFGPIQFSTGSPYGTPVTGAVINDTGGYDAWNIDTMDRSGTNAFPQKYGVYQHLWTPTEQARLTGPMYFVARLRVLEDSQAGADSVDYSIVPWIEFNGRGYRPMFGINSSNQLVVNLYHLGTFGTPTSSGPFVISSSPTAAYHEMVLSDLDGDGGFDFYVDNTLLYSNYTGDVIANTAGNNRIVFGDGSATSNQNGNANWNEVALYVPEPASVILLVGVAAVPMLRRRHRIHH